MNNIIALLLRTKKQTRVGAAPEMYLQDLDENAGSQCDIWAIGTILYKIFWGNWIVDDEDKNPVEILLKFKDDHHIKNTLFTKEKKEKLCFNQDLDDNPDYEKVIRSIIS